MLETSQVLSIAVVLAAVALWLLLPRWGVGLRRRAVGVVLGLMSLGLFVSQWPGLGCWTTQAVVGLLAVVTVIAAGAMVSAHNPVYAAVWFGLALLGTAGLLFVQGAQFLAVATVVVYAGAILVTFLFVLLLAQPDGRTACDRTSTEALVSAAAGAVMVGVLSIAMGLALGAPQPLEGMATDAQRAEGVLSNVHVAQLGTELFSRHLIAVEVAGVLLLVALVGATVVAAGQEKRDNELEGQED